MGRGTFSLNVSRVSSVSRVPERWLLVNSGREMKEEIKSHNKLTTQTHSHMLSIVE